MKIQYLQNVKSPQLDVQMNVISIKILATYFIDIGKMNLKLIYRGKRSWTASTILKEKNKIEGLMLPSVRCTVILTLINFTMKLQ